MASVGIYIFLGILLFVIAVIVIIAILLYVDKEEVSALEGNFFLRSIGNLLGIPTYMLNDSGKVVSINDSTISCQSYSWSFSSNELQSKGGGTIFVTSATEGPVSLGNPSPTDLSKWNYDLSSQSFCLISDPSLCLYNNNAVVELKKFGLGGTGFGWVPESKTTNKICS